MSGARELKLPTIDTPQGKVATLEGWREFARRDDCLHRMVPSDLRMILANILPEPNEDRLTLVLLESPYAGDVLRNTNYGRLCLRDSLERGEAPMASHLLYTQPMVLDDDDPEERRRGMAAGHAWMDVVDAMVVYADHGITPGMAEAIGLAEAAGLPVHYRYIEQNARYEATSA